MSSCATSTGRRSKLRALAQHAIEAHCARQRRRLEPACVRGAATKLTSSDFGKPSMSPTPVTMTCFTSVRAITSCSTCAKFSRIRIAFAPESLSWCSSSRARVQRVGVDDRHAGAQHAGDRHRVLQDVGHHQRDAIALREPGDVLQPGTEATAVFVDIPVAQRHVHVGVRRLVAILGKTLFEKVLERRVPAGIDFRRHALRVVLEPDLVHESSSLVLLCARSWFACCPSACRYIASPSVKQQWHRRAARGRTLHADDTRVGVNAPAAARAWAKAYREGWAARAPTGECRPLASATHRGRPPRAGTAPAAGDSVPRGR